ncbi:MAG: EAL domain-containing protein [Clostridiales Family XIII bacterium]|nr:EAL domain-containing protein [Clostridiales Family XIII bacterium]
MLGISKELESGAFELLDEKTLRCADGLENKMKDGWGMISDLRDIANLHFSNILNGTDKKTDAMLTDEKTQNSFLESMSGELAHLIYRNDVSGAFIILEGEKPEKPGIYFLDEDPGARRGDFSDIIMKTAPAALADKLGLYHDTPLDGGFLLEKGADSSDFYYKPYGAATENPDMDVAELGYWSWHDGNGGGLPLADGAFIYSQPLSHMGLVYGVCGVAIDGGALRDFLKTGGMSGLSEAGCGVLHEKDGENMLVAAQGEAFGRVDGPVRGLTLEPDKSEGAYIVEGLAAQGKIYGVLSVLSLYAPESPFADDSWAVLGFRSEEALLGYAERSGYIVLLILLAALTIGVAGIVIVAKMITIPVGVLASQLKLKDPNSKIELDKLGILEIDELSDAIETLSAKVADVNRKLADILEMAETSIAVFEYHDRNNNQVIYTRQFAQMFDLPETENNAMELRRFLSHVRRNAPEKESVSPQNGEIVYRIYFDGKNHWIRFLPIKSPAHLTGVITDVTKEIEDRKRLEHERDYDILTDVYNRRAFYKFLKTRFASPKEMKTAAVIMLDLDNLKSVNDAFGHDYGDKYIRLTADALRAFGSERSIVARLAGDEFIIFLFGYDSQDEIREICERIKETMKRGTLNLPDGTNTGIQISAGIAWYPHDSADSEELIRYADFAMYMVKKTNKGQFKEFDYGFYNKHSYLRYSKNEMDMIIDNELISYQFQPIINAANGEIYAYEALMRPGGETIQNPAALVSLARAHSRLPQIERITFFKALEEFSTLKAATETNCKLFINSIASQFLNEEEVDEFIKLHGDFMGRLVLEITEEERNDEVAMSQKLAFMRRYGQKLALDDFGVGYSNESTMLDYSPDFIKIDMSIIRNIHEDENRKSITSKLIAYGKNAGIRMLAEGVEVKEEMEYLISAGIDLLQGFYICRPMSVPPIDLPDIKAEIAAMKRRRHG